VCAVYNVGCVCVCVCTGRVGSVHTDVCSRLEILPYLSFIDLAEQMRLAEDLYLVAPSSPVLIVFKQQHIAAVDCYNIIIDD
jgi:hypothetical protein